jgi:hypothetical protein
MKTGMLPFSIVVALVVLLCQSVEADDVGMFHERTCDNENCVLTLHSAPQRVLNSSGDWVEVVRVDYINGTPIIYTEIDTNTYLWIEDVKPNGLARGCVNVTELNTKMDVPLTVTYKDKTFSTDQIRLNKNTDVFCTNFDINSLEGIQFGEHSTEIKISGATGLIEDAMFDEDSTLNGAGTAMYADLIDGTGEIPCVKFNISVVPSGSTIDNVTVYLYAAASRSETVEVWHGTNQTWLEEELDDLCNNGTYCSDLVDQGFLTTKIADDIFKSVSSAYEPFHNLHSGMQDDIDNSRGYTTYCWNHTGNAANFQAWDTKEGTNDPYTNVTYTEAAAADANFTLNLTVRDTVSGDAYAAYASLCFYLNDTYLDCWSLSKDKDYGEIGIDLGDMDYDDDTLSIVVNGTSSDGVYLSNIRIFDSSGNRVSFTPWSFSESNSEVKNITISDSKLIMGLPLYKTGSQRYANYTSAVIEQAPDFVINQSDMTLNQTIYNISDGESINISVVVHNVGSLSGSGVVQLTANDVFVANSTMLTINNGSSGFTNFTYAVDYDSKNILKLKVEVIPNSTEGLDDDNYAVKYLIENRPYMLFTDWSAIPGSVYSAQEPYATWLTALTSKAATANATDYSAGGGVNEWTKADRLASLAMRYYSSGYDVGYANSACDGLAYAFTETGWEWANRSASGNATDGSGSSGGQQNYDLGTSSYGSAQLMRLFTNYGVAYDLMHDYMFENCTANLTTFRDSFGRALADGYLQFREYYSYTGVAINTGESYSLYSFGSDPGLRRMEAESGWGSGILSLLDYDGTYQDLDGSPYDWADFVERDMFDASLTGASETELELQCSADGFFEDSEYYQYYESGLAHFMAFYNNTFEVSLNDSYGMADDYAFALPMTANPTFTLANYITAYRSIWQFMYPMTILFADGSNMKALIDQYLNNTVAHYALSSDTGYLIESTDFNDAYYHLVFYNSSAGTTVTGEPSYVAPQNTYAVFRSSWDETALYSLYKTASHGEPLTAGTAAGHSHQNTFNIWAKRAYLLPDSGQARYADVSVYGSGSKIREHSNKASHNTFVIANSTGFFQSLYRQPNSQYTGPFNPSKINDSMLSDYLDYATQTVYMGYAVPHSKVGATREALATNFTWTRHLLMIRDDYFISVDDIVGDAEVNLRAVIPLGSTKFISSDGYSSSNEPEDNYANGTLYIDDVNTTWFQPASNSSRGATLGNVQNITWATYSENNSAYTTTYEVNLSIFLNPTRETYLNNFTYINASYMHWGSDSKGYEFARPDIKTDAGNVTTFRNLYVYYPTNITDTQASFDNLTVAGGSGDDYATQVTIGTRTDVVITGDPGTDYFAGYLGCDGEVCFGENDTSTGWAVIFAYNATNITIDNAQIVGSNSTFDYAMCNRTTTDNNMTCRIKNDASLNMTFYVDNSTTTNVTQDGVYLTEGTDWDQNGDNEIWVQPTGDLSSEVTLVITSGGITDTSAPSITYLSPTPDNTTLEWDGFYINVTVDEAASACLAEVNGTNYTMTNIAGNNWQYLKTGGSHEDMYVFLVYCNDSAGNMNRTASRYVILDWPGSPGAGPGGPVGDALTTPIDEIFPFLPESDWQVWQVLAIIIIMIAVVWVVTR